MIVSLDRCCCFGGSLNDIDSDAKDSQSSCVLYADMIAAKKLQLISVEDYLAGELVSDVKHEYIDGVVYAMAGARNVHNLIATNVTGILHFRLRGTSCRPYNSDTKIRIRRKSDVRFYYPDASIICESNAATDSFQDCPIAIVEVLSDKTRRIDEGEKKDLYLTITSLRIYLLVEQAEPAVTVHRWANGDFIRETYYGLKAVIPLPEIDTELPLSDLYDAVEFPAASDTE